jgi:MinD-like ATPase involved in chromosome partitioning or flagellar assembly
MSNVHNPDWDDEELVPLGDLRPSRKHFGPLPDPQDNAHGGRFGHLNARHGGSTKSGNSNSRQAGARGSSQDRQRNKAAQGRSGQRQSQGRHEQDGQRRGGAGRNQGQDRNAGQGGRQGRDRGLNQGGRQVQGGDFGQGGRQAQDRSYNQGERQGRDRGFGQGERQAQDSGYDQGWSSNQGPRSRDGGQARNSPQPGNQQRATSERQSGGSRRARDAEVDVQDNWPVQRPTSHQVSQPRRTAEIYEPPARRPERHAELEREPQSARQHQGSTGQLQEMIGTVASAGIRNVLSRVGVASSQDDESLDEIMAPVVDGTVSVFSRKGGVGKTTISAYLGLTFASLRGGRILAIDGDAEAGSLGWLLAPDAPATLAALSTARPLPSSYNEFRSFTATADEGLEVVVGDTDGEQVVDDAGLEDALVEIARNYDISIYDTGGGVSLSAGRVLIRHAKVMLLVMGPSVDSIRAAERTLAWVEDRPGEAVDPDVKIIAVINGVPNTVKEAHIQRIEEHFAARCAGVVRIPWDEYLAEGNSSASLSALNKNTQKAFVNLGAVVVKAAGAPRGRRQMQGGRRAS